jgi:hypothetical protein
MSKPATYVTTTGPRGGKKFINSKGHEEYGTPPKAAPAKPKAAKPARPAAKPVEPGAVVFSSSRYEHKASKEKQPKAVLDFVGTHAKVEQLMHGKATLPPGAGLWFGRGNRENAVFAIPIEPGHVEKGIIPGHPDYGDKPATHAYVKIDAEKSGKYRVHVELTSGLHIGAEERQAYLDSMGGHKKIPLPRAAGLSDSVHAAAEAKWDSLERKKLDYFHSDAKVHYIDGTVFAEKPAPGKRPVPGYDAIMASNIKALTPEQRAAYTEYSRGHFHGVRLLHTGHTDFESFNREMLKKTGWENTTRPEMEQFYAEAKVVARRMDDTVDKMKPLPPLKVYRGMQVSPEGLHALLTAKSYTAETHLSTSSETVHPSAFLARRKEGTPVMMTFHTTSGKPIEDLAQHQEEREVLIPRGRKFAVVNHTRSLDGDVLEVHLREVAE